MLKRSKISQFVKMNYITLVYNVSRRLKSEKFHFPKWITRENNNIAKYRAINVVYLFYVPFFFVLIYVILFFFNPLPIKFYHMCIHIYSLYNTFI